MKNALRHFAAQLPTPIRWQLKRWQWAGTARYCPICGSTVREFLAAGLIDRRADAKCPVCLSMERHRLAWYFMQQHTTLLDGQPKRLLHIAPESNLSQRFQQMPGLDYLTADLNNPAVMVQMDITAIQYPDAYFDVIYCSHVLEHVPNDQRAMQEFYRVLHPQGWMILQVPVQEGATYEDPRITSPQERLKHFGQEDHVRLYGRQDFARRLETQGFAVREFSAADFPTPQLVEKLQPKEQNLYYCTKN